MDLLLGIDVGSTNTKAVLFDAAGNIRHAGSAETKLSRDPAHPSWTYWDPEDIWNGVVTSIRRAISDLRADERIIAGACSCFSADFVPLDANLRPLYPFKSWHCMRVLPQMEKWLETHGADDLFYRHGRATEPLVSLFMMRWMWDEIPDIAEKTCKMLLIADYINYRLTGELATDYTVAATTGAFDPIEGKWDAEYLAWAGFTPDHMPHAVPAGSPIGHITGEAAVQTGLSSDVLMVAGAHDNECGCLSMGMKDTSAAYNVCGTWDMVLAMHHEPKRDENRAKQHMAVIRYFLPDTWCSIKYGLGASLMEWGKDSLYRAEALRDSGGNSVWDVILAETREKPPLSNGVLALPFRTGFNGEQIQRLASGSIMGLRAETDRADVMHAIFETLGYQTLEYLNILESVCGRRFDTIVCAGGPANNRQLMQIKADICNRPVVITDVREGTAHGAAMLAGIGSGVYEDAYRAISAVTAKRMECVYEPDMRNTEKYRRGYAEYARITELIK